MERIGAHDYFIGMADVLLEFARVQNDIHQYSVRFIEIYDFEAVFCKRNSGVGQNVFYGGNHISYGLDLDGFNSENIVLLVHWKTRFYKIQTHRAFIFYF
jgi:hypothetical protein